MARASSAPGKSSCNRSRHRMRAGHGQRSGAGARIRHEELLGAVLRPGLRCSPVRGEGRSRGSCDAEDAGARGRSAHCRQHGRSHGRRSAGALAMLLAMGQCSFVAGLSASELRSSVPVHGALGGTVRNRQHIYFVNVSGLSGHPSSPQAIAPQRLSVRLTQEKPADARRVEPLVLSLCRDQLPCGDLGCSCPSKFVDDGTRGGIYSGELAKMPDLVRSVDVSPCELESGTWYVSVDLPADRGRAMADSRTSRVGYTLTAVLESASLSVSEATADEVCCMQSQYFVLEISKLVKGNELSVKLISDDRLHNQSPLKLSLSYDGCIDDQVDMVSDAKMGQVVTLPPEQVHRGRLFVGVHSIDRDSARFLISVSYRPELKWTVIAFLVSVLVIVVVTIAVVCCVRVRRRMRKMKTFSEEVKLRKKNLKMSVRGASSEDGSCAGSSKPGKVELSDSDESAEEGEVLLNGTRSMLDLL